MEWWSEFYRRVDTGRIEFRDVLSHYADLWSLQMNGCGFGAASEPPCPRTIGECYTELKSFSGNTKISEIESLLKRLQEVEGKTPRLEWDSKRKHETARSLRRRIHEIMRDFSAQQRIAGRNTTYDPQQSAPFENWSHVIQRNSRAQNRRRGSAHMIAPNTSSGNVFFTPQTHNSGDTFFTAHSPYVASYQQLVTPPTHSNELSPSVSFHGLLKSKGLWPIHYLKENDWSGRGEHVEFNKSEKKEIQKILPIEQLLGTSNYAVVESVRCKRIYLARKTIRCGKHFTKEQAIDEVAHLHKVRHSHIVQVVGTYSIGNYLSILLFPVAEYNLETFLSEFNDDCLKRDRLLDPDRPNLWAVSDFFGCLSKAVEYIHDNMTKHMDIKPKNILVRNMAGKSAPHRLPWKVYIADFGIARSYSTLEASETEGPTMFTKRYAAPEVVARERRGLPADIFSLGCVFTEIAVALVQAASQAYR
ncbi:kinase-like protein, partial [Lindgomyces ingoldianus]